MSAVPSFNVKSAAIVSQPPRDFRSCKPNPGEVLPEPLSQADCDLRGLHFMPLDVTRLLHSDTYALSSGTEFKAMLTLWAASWLQVPAGSLPNDDRIMAHFCHISVAQWETVKTIALRGWILCNDGRLYHAFIAERAMEALATRLERPAFKAAKGSRDRVAKFRRQRNTLIHLLESAGVAFSRDAGMPVLRSIAQQHGIAIPTGDEVDLGNDATGVTPVTPIGNVTRNGYGNVTVTAETGRGNEGGNEGVTTKRTARNVTPERNVTGNAVTGNTVTGDALRGQGQSWPDGSEDDACVSHPFVEGGGSDGDGTPSRGDGRNSAGNDGSDGGSDGGSGRNGQALQAGVTGSPGDVSAPEDTPPMQVLAEEALNGLRQVGIADGHAGDERLIALLEKGVTVAQLAAAGAIAAKKNKGFAYAMGVAESKRLEGQNARAHAPRPVTQGPLQAVQPDTGSGAVADQTRGMFGIDPRDTAGLRPQVLSPKGLQSAVNIQSFITKLHQSESEQGEQA